MLNVYGNSVLCHNGIPPWYRARMGPRVHLRARDATRRMGDPVASDRVAWNVEHDSVRTSWVCPAWASAGVGGVKTEQ